MFDDGDWLVEITRVGDWLRVAVIDPRTNREAVVHGPPRASAEELFRLARRKLEGRRAPASPPPGLYV
jgi:hypothetical protein